LTLFEEIGWRKVLKEDSTTVGDVQVRDRRRRS